MFGVFIKFYSHFINSEVRTLGKYSLVVSHQEELSECYLLLLRLKIYNPPVTVSALNIKTISHSNNNQLIN